LIRRPVVSAGDFRQSPADVESKTISSQLKGPRAALFGEHWRDWPRKWVQRLCKAAGVPKVTAHAMRGLHSTLAVDSGITSHAVAAALGHESFKTTAESYAQREAVAGAQQKKVLGVLAGGKAAS
jgi:integrase